MLASPVRPGKREKLRRRGVAPSRGMPQRPNPRSSPFDQAQDVAARPARLTYHFIHQRAHEEDAAAADAHFAWIKARHGCQIKRITLVVQAHLDAIRPKHTFDLECQRSVITMCVA